ncbi:STM4504/CBY_0614 family protein [Spirosoma aerolatum]|uniref:STM4504/CBY_0614 family protein n=1 Tax=Spirosoma aerolatum TaxID=1211326 RepID=UPI0009AE10A5|nr:hypothetical protein [Spirosoma aerolatum]
MPVYDLYSKRQKLLREGPIDVFTYDEISQKLRMQIIFIIQDVVGEAEYSSELESGDIYIWVHNTLCREYGLESLVGNYNLSYSDRIFLFFKQESNVDRVIDVVELFFGLINGVIRDDDDYSTNNKIKCSPDAAINELNCRLKESGVGYQFEGNEIIRVDSTYVHSEIVKPVLGLLANSKFEGANEEYLKAHEHYRHNRNKECLTECLKAFESTMKIICKEKGWNYKETDTASTLINILFQNNLVPAFTQNQFTGLQNMLISGVPTIRNKTSGHGQGQTPIVVSDDMTRYGLNLTGSNIIFLVEQSGIK